MGRIVICHRMGLISQHRDSIMRRLRDILLVIVVALLEEEEEVSRYNSSSTKRTTLTIIIMNLEVQF